jgi:AraC family carnitine catabolism transcriptional activator
MLLPVEGDLTAAADCRTVFVLASFEVDQTLGDRSLLRWLRRSARFGVELCGIENGSLVLAAAGLLDGHRAAVHWDNLAGFHEHRPATRPVAQLFARHAGRITCAGASAILDLMIAWLGWQGEAGLAAEVADHLLMGSPRSGETGQKVTAAAAPSQADGLVRAAEQLMREHIDEPLDCADIARRVGLSLRQIERRFKQSTGESVLQRYRLIRMAKAHQLLQQTDLSVTEVALACGFAAPEYFCRLYRREFKCSPSEDRRQSTTAPVLRRRHLPERALS